MIRVLVAEDEPPIMRANIAAIESSNVDFKVVATAINGKRAINELKNQKIDVVFTDVRMPVMDGLELAEHIKSNYPNIFTVITSGYSDFEYARKAIEFKVQDYILKPVSKTKLSELLGNIKKEISKKNYEEKRRILIDGSNEANVELGDSECMVIIACAGAVSLSNNDKLEHSMTFSNKVVMNEIIAGILEEGEEYILFRGNTAAEWVIIIESTKSDRMEKIAEKIFNSLKNENNITINLNCKKGIKFSETSEAIRQLRDDMIRNIILTKSQIRYCNDISEDNSIPTYSTEQVEYLAKSLRTGDEEKVKSCISEIFADMDKSNATQEDITNFLDILIDYYYFISKAANKKNNIVKKKIYSSIANFKDYESITDDVVSILCNIAPPEPKHYVKHPKLIEKIEEYLKENYQKNITNTILSKEFAFVPSYISRKFREYNGVSPGEYLTSYRIEMAKMIMQEKPELMVKEVADMVGFHDAYYFSKTFKKKTGIWPTEYNVK